MLMSQDKERFNNAPENSGENLPDSIRERDSHADYDEYLRDLTERYSAEDEDSAVSENKAEKAQPAVKTDDKKKKKNIFLVWWEKFLALSKGKKAAIIIAAILALILIITASIASYYINLVDWGGDGYEPPTGDYIADDDPDLDPMHTVTDAEGFSDYLQKWHDNNGDIMQSKNVINVLLLGLDDSRFRSDAMILLSLNKVTKEIKMVSLYRDTWTYSEAFSKVNNGNYMKLTEVYGWGGPDILVKTIEKDYKIKIDGYVSVTFQTFPKVIDALGGVRVDVKPNEAAEMTNVWKVPVQSGEDVLLNGKQALFFCRIRHCDVDGDVSRTRRQRMVIESLINASKNASIGQIENVLSTLLPNVSTSFSRTDFVKYATQAITYKWMNYPIEQLQMPNEANRTSSYINTLWVWIADFPGCARDLQTALYGKTNIEIPEGSKTAMDFFKSNSSSSDSKKPSQSESASESESESESESREKPSFDFPWLPKPSESNEEDTGSTETDAPPVSPDEPEEPAGE